MEGGDDLQNQSQDPRRSGDSSAGKDYVRDSGVGDQSELTELLRAGRKIEAIKLYREQTGLGLKEAKEAVERLAQEQKIVLPGGTGCLGALVFLAATAGAAIAWGARW